MPSHQYEVLGDITEIEVRGRCVVVFLQLCHGTSLRLPELGKLVDIYAYLQKIGVETLGRTAYTHVRPRTFHKTSEVIT